MTISDKSANKGRFDFYEKVMEKLRELDKTHGHRLIRFPLVFYKLGCNFGLKKTEIKLILKDLTDEGRISFHPFNGIRILD